MTMPTYIVLADRHTVHVTRQVNGEDKTVRFESLNRGDEVEMDEADAERLVRTGGLVLKAEVRSAKEQALDRAEAEIAAQRQALGLSDTAPNAGNSRADDGYAVAPGATPGQKDPGEGQTEPLADADAAQDSVPGGDPKAAPSGDEDDDADVPYLDTLDKKGLQEEAESRGLSKSGNMDELKERIREYDADQESEDEDDES